MEKKKVVKPKKTDDIIKVQNRILSLEQQIINLETGLKLALSRLGLQKEYRNGE